MCYYLCFNNTCKPSLPSRSPSMLPSIFRKNSRIWVLMTLLAYSAQLLASAGSLLILPMDEQKTSNASCHSVPSMVSQAIPSVAASVQLFNPPTISQSSSTSILNLMVDHDSMTCCDSDSCDMPSCHTSCAILDHFIVPAFPFGHHPALLPSVASLPAFVVPQYRPPMLG